MIPVILTALAAATQAQMPAPAPVATDPQPPAKPADIELHARIQARSVVVDQSGPARLTTRAEPDAGSSVEIKGPPKGRRRYANVTATVDAEARLANPAEQRVDETEPR